MKIIVYSTKKRKIGDKMQLGNYNGHTSQGEIVGLVSDDPKYQGHRVCGHSKPVNTGEDYYYVKIAE